VITRRRRERGRRMQVNRKQIISPSWKFEFERWTLDKKISEKTELKRVVK
jgi:hypothetical protein